MNNLLQKLLRLKTPVKIAATVGVMVAILGAYGGLYLDVQAQIKAAQAKQEQLKIEKDNYGKREREYLAYRSELTQLQQEQRDLLKALPPSVPRSQHSFRIFKEAELAGLEIVSLTIDAESPQELYVRIPYASKCTAATTRLPSSSRTSADCPVS